MAVHNCNEWKKEMPLSPYDQVMLLEMSMSESLCILAEIQE